MEGLVKRAKQVYEVLELIKAGFCFQQKCDVAGVSRGAATADKPADPTRDLAASFLENVIADRFSPGQLMTPDQQP